MPDFDSIIRNGTIVTADAIRRADIGITEGKIAAIDANLSGSAREEIDASDLHVFPGVIDAHVHFNDPGRTDWEGIETGSCALAAGGGTMFFDMHRSTPVIRRRAIKKVSSLRKPLPNQVRHRLRPLGRPRPRQPQKT